MPNILILLLKFVLVIFLEPIVPFGVFLFPILIFPYVVQFLFSGGRSAIGPLLKGMSALAAADDIYGQPLYCVLLFYFVDGEIDITEHRKMFREKVVDARDAKTGELIYPQLRSAITRILGYSFWKKDPEFKLENHIKLCDKKEFNLKPGEEIDEQVVARTTNQFLSKPFTEGRSPWEILIFHGAKCQESKEKKQSLVAFRYHHALSDGYSITDLMSNVTTGDYYQAPAAKRKVPVWKELLHFFAFPFVGTFVVVTYMTKYIDTNRWRFQAQGGRNMNYYCTEAIEVDQVKRAKAKLNVNFNAVVLSGIAGGIRKYFMLKKEPVPQGMHVGIAVPVPGHPTKKLTNHWTAVIVNLHTEMSDPLSRLKAINTDMRSKETKVVSQMPFLGSQWGGSLPAWVIKLILKHLLHGSTGAMSIFPGPANLKFLTGEKILSGGFILGPLETQGVSITVISYNGRLRVYFGLEQALEDGPGDGKLITDCIHDQIKSFVTFSDRAA